MMHPHSPAWGSRTGSIAKCHICNKWIEHKWIGGLATQAWAEIPSTKLEDLVRAGVIGE